MTKFGNVIIIWHKKLIIYFKGEMDMKYFTALMLGLMFFASSALADAPQVTDYNRDPATALHPFRILSLAVRPPIGISSIFIKGTYWVFDSYPIRRAFNIEYNSTLNIDEDY